MSPAKKMSIPAKRCRLVKRLECANPSTGQITCRGYRFFKDIETGDRCKRSLSQSKFLACIRRFDKIAKNPNMGAKSLRAFVAREIAELCCYAHGDKGRDRLVDELCAAIETYRLLDLEWQPANAGVRCTVRTGWDRQRNGKEREKRGREKKARRKREQEKTMERQETMEQEKTREQVKALTIELKKEREKRMELSMEQIVVLTRELRL